MRIKTKKQLDFFIKSDWMMNRGKFKPSLTDRIKGAIVPDDIMSYLVAMRKVSYYHSGGAF